MQRQLSTYKSTPGPHRNDFNSSCFFGPSKVVSDCSSFAGKIKVAKRKVCRPGGKRGGELDGRVWERWIWNECNLAKICKERSHTGTPTYTHTHSDIKHWSDKRNEKRLCKLILRCTNNNNYGNSYRSNESNCVCDNTERKVKEYICRNTKILVHKKIRINSN